jgi:hypothetical protein
LCIPVRGSAKLSKIQSVAGSESSALSGYLSPRIVCFTKRWPSTALGRSGLSLNVCAMLDEDLNCGCMAFISRPHQWCRAVLRFFRIYIRAMIEQHFDGIHVSGACRLHERSSSEGLPLIRIGARSEQCCDDAGIAIDAGKPQRSGTVTVRRLDVRACANQHVHCFLVAVIHGPMKSGSTIGLGNVDISLLLNQGPKHGFVPLHGGIRDVGPARSQAAHRQQQRCGQNLREAQAR